MAQPTLARLAARWPGAGLDVLAPAWCAPLLRRMAEVDGIVDNPLPHRRLGLAERLRIGRSLRGRYARAVILPNSFKSALIPLFAGIPVRTGYVGESRTLILTDSRRFDAERMPRLVDRYYALAGAPDTPGEAAPAPRLADLPDRRAATLARLGLPADPGPVAVLCPGAEFGPAKRWPAEHYGEVARTLAERGLRVWLVGSAGDRAQADAVVAASREACLNLCGRTDLEQAVDLVATASVVVCNDSGLMHVAAALGRPVVAVYGSSSAAYTPPLSRLARIVRLGLACSPCFQRECPLGHLDCLRRLGPELVLAQASDLAATRGTDAPASP
jgi:heptosyltransferase II